MQHQRPCRRPLRPESAALALWATPVHASSMVDRWSRRPTTTLVLTLDGDANVCREQRRCDAARTLPSAADHRVVEDRTQWMVLSAIFNNRLVCGAREGPGSILWSAAATNIAFEPPAQR